MALKNNVFEKSFYDKREILEREARESVLFENFSNKLKMHIIASFTRLDKKYPTLNKSFERQTLKLQKFNIKLTCLILVEVCYVWRRLKYNRRMSLSSSVDFHA